MVVSTMFDDRIISLNSYHNSAVSCMFSLCSRPHPTTGEGGVGDADPDAVATGRQHNVHQRRDVVRGPAGCLPGGPPERAGLGVRPRRRRLLPAAAGRPVLPAEHSPHPRLLRLQHLLPAERQLRHRLQLRRRRSPRQAGSKYVNFVPCAPSIMCSF
jgi:hypothetical protein